MAASPRKGYLAVKAPSEDFVLRMIGNRQMDSGEPGGQTLYSHAFLPYEAKADGDAPELEVSLRRGVTVTGRVIGPDDQPVPNNWIVGRLALMPSTSAWYAWRGDYHRIALEGRFELHGLDPESETPVVFLEPKRKLAATVYLSGNSAAKQPFTVRLEPCGTAKARLVDKGNKPLTAYRDQFMISMIITPRVPVHQSVFPSPVDESTVPAPHAIPVLSESDFLVRFDPVNHPKPPAPDAQGRIVLPALIPGVTYQIVDRTAAQTPGGPPIRKKFTVKPGETVDLGDILIEKPGP
jgi:hypothetical protein